MFLDKRWDDKIFGTEKWKGLLEFKLLLTSPQI
jgi:hypothetical protein